MDRTLTRSNVQKCTLVYRSVHELHGCPSMYIGVQNCTTSFRSVSVLIHGEIGSSIYPRQTLYRSVRSRRGKVLIVNVHFCTTMSRSVHHTESRRDPRQRRVRLSNSAVVRKVRL